MTLNKNEIGVAVKVGSECKLSSWSDRSVV